MVKCFGSADDQLCGNVYNCSILAQDEVATFPKVTTALWIIAIYNHSLKLCMISATL